MGPLIVCGTGGSGTRAIADYLIHGGLYMGAALNPSLDSLPFANVVKRFSPAWLRHHAGIGSDFARDEFQRAWSEAVALHCQDLTAGACWGTKNPGMILLIDLLSESLADARFLQVVRNGIHMAFSSNHRQLALYGNVILGADFDHESQEARALRLWARVNARCAATGERLAGRYGLIRYEDFCLDPQGEMRRVAESMGIVLDHDRSAQRNYQPSPRELPNDWRSRVGEALDEARPVLDAFAYRC